MEKLSKKELEDLLAIMERNSIEYSVTNNSDEIRLIPEIQQACKQIKAMLQETEKAKLIWDATCPGRAKKLDAQFVKVLEAGKKLRAGDPQELKIIEAFLKEYKKLPEIGKDWLPTAENINALPEPVRNYIAGLETNADPPSMVADNIIMKDTIKTLEKMLEELPEITEAWTDAKAKEIKALVKQAQDEDLSDPALDLHYLGLSLDIVTSIIDDLRPR